MFFLQPQLVCLNTKDNVELVCLGINCDLEILFILLTWKLNTFQAGTMGQRIGCLPCTLIRVRSLAFIDPPKAHQK